MIVLKKYNTFNSKEWKQHQYVMTILIKIRISFPINLGDIYNALFSTTQTKCIRPTRKNWTQNKNTVLCEPLSYDKVNMIFIC